jgi:hypothetical protein
LATPSTKSIDHYPDTLIAHGQWSELRYRPRGICRERKTGGQQQGTFKTSRSEYGDSGEPIQESLHRKILKQFLKRATLRARFDITQALAVSELREGHAQELVPAGEATRPAVAMVAGHAAAKLAVGQVGNKLREHRAAKVHASWCTSRRSNRGKRKAALSGRPSAGCPDRSGC